MKTETYTQQTFKALMKAMSRPGTVCLLNPAEGDAPFMPVLRTLLDHEVTFAVAGEYADSGRIAMVTGARAAPVEEADYLLVPGGDSAGTVLRAKRGDLRYPDQGATVIYLVKSLQGGDTSICLKGPGIALEQYLTVDGLSHREIIDVMMANASFPLGIDCIFVDEVAMAAAVPRSVRMEVA